jgi:hypothetical protein
MVEKYREHGNATHTVELNDAFGLVIGAELLGLGRCKLLRHRIPSFRSPAAWAWRSSKAVRILSKRN